MSDTVSLGGAGEPHVPSESPRAAAYFTRIEPNRFRPSPVVGGAWNTAEQHVAPALGLLCHVVERDRDERRGRPVDGGPVVARLCWDILGTLPIEDVETDVRVVRPGRTVELVEATLSHAGRPALTLRAWLLQGRDTASVAGTDLPSMPAPLEMPEWSPASQWAGPFVASATVRRRLWSPGRGQVWVRTAHPLVADEVVAPVSRFAGLLDISNGMAVRADPSEVAFPNLDLTAHLFREPAGDWLGFDTTVTFGPGGVGLTSSVLHDEQGPFGTSQQILTVRPR